MRRGHELGLILMDVDHFKAYNDNYGHQQGDQCLIDVARILTAYAPPESCVARYGGEEFVVLLPYTTHFEALEIARNFVTRVAVTGIRHEFSPVAPHLTISAGLSVVRPSPQFSSSKLLQNADKALYQAKHNGRNQVVSDRTAGVLDSDDKPVIELDDFWQTEVTPPESSVVASTPRESARG
ncbi:MAG: GGDEF domain-containing protein, partial [Pseudomonadota bacterium]